MPTPEENMQSVRTFAEEVIGNKNLKLRTTGSLTISSNIKCSCRHARQEGCNRLLSHHLRDMVAAGGKVAIRATYRGTDKGGFIPGMPATGNLRNGGHVHGPDQQRGTDRRALRCH